MTNGKAVMAYNSAARWLGVRLENLGALVTFFTGILCWYYRSVISPELTGLALLWAFNFTISLNFMVSKSTELESKMTSVQRMLDYTNNLTPEASLHLDPRHPNDTSQFETKNKSEIKSEIKSKSIKWPTEGLVEFDNVVLSYADNLPPVLNKCTFTAQPGEKIGVVGRTGAGKSTLATALFRLREVTRGAIRVDGIDISTLGLADVRGRGVCIIPQDPVLFSGTLR